MSDKDLKNEIKQDRKELTANLSKLCMQLVISLSVFFVCLYIILSKDYPISTEKWAYGAVGTIIGYWVR